MTMNCRYFTLACRIATDHDDEIDFIIDGESLVVKAIEVCDRFGISEAHDKLMARFPRHKVITTHLPLFELLGIELELLDLEAQMAEQFVGMSSRTGRIAEAFNWERKHDAIRQYGSC